MPSPLQKLTIILLEMIMALLNSITYLGHSAIILDGELTVAIDPWLMGNPLCPPEFHTPPKLDLIVLSHGHADHAGDCLRLAQATKAKVAATYELAMILVSEGLDAEQVIPMNKGGTVNFSGLQVTLSHAFHSSSYDTKNGPLYAGEPCSVIISDTVNTIFHAGDTALFSDLALIGQSYKIDFALLPIGDHFTMNPKEAAQAAMMLQAKLALPIHYKTFPLLTGTASEFINYCGKIDKNAKELKIGQSYKFRELI
jgi:L-ascorbate metabolism protein UlaG (beta-lactamase superfamily)